MPPKDAGGRAPIGLNCAGCEPEPEAEPDSAGSARGAACLTAVLVGGVAPSASASSGPSLNFVGAPPASSGVSCRTAILVGGIDPASGPSSGPSPTIGAASSAAPTGRPPPVPSSDGVGVPSSAAAYLADTRYYAVWHVPNHPAIRGVVTSAGTRAYDRLCGLGGGFREIRWSREDSFIEAVDAFRFGSSKQENIKFFVDGDF